MPSPEPPSDFNDLVGKARQQGNRFNTLEPPTKEPFSVYGLLAKADLDEDQAWDLLFEVVSSAWLQAVLIDPPGRIEADLPKGPGLFLHAPEAKEADAVAALGLDDASQIVEGSWYELDLIRSNKALAGFLFEPDLEALPDEAPPSLATAEPTDMYHGVWAISAAEMVSVPRFEAPKASKARQKIDFNAHPYKPQAKPDGNNGQPKRVSLRNMRPTTAPIVAVSPQGKAPDPAYRSVAVMDVGTGNCNLLISSQGEPEAYFDVGFPLSFYHQTSPAGLRAGGGGPILQNNARNLRVILSHWDYDHWMLGQRWPDLKKLRWTVPDQPVGTPAKNFFKALKKEAAQVEVFPPDSPSRNEGGFILHGAMPPDDMHQSGFFNNTGLAVQVTLGQDPPFVALTADANFESVVGLLPASKARLFGITAVHHGSEANGADENLPPVPNGDARRIAYSYGRYPTNDPRHPGAHPYGFPRANSVTAYRNARWGSAAAPPQREFGTAEGPAINQAGDPARGNICFGAQPDLAGYAATAFAYFPFQLT